jgi:hypothetical protein
MPCDSPLQERVGCCARIDRLPRGTQRRKRKISSGMASIATNNGQTCRIRGHSGPSGRRATCTRRLQCLRAGLLASPRGTSGGHMVRRGALRGWRTAFPGCREIFPGARHGSWTRRFVFTTHRLVLGDDGVCVRRVLVVYRVRALGLRPIASLLPSIASHRPAIHRNNGPAHRIDACRIAVGTVRDVPSEDSMAPLASSIVLRLHRIDSSRNCNRHAHSSTLSARRGFGTCNGWHTRSVRASSRSACGASVGRVTDQQFHHKCRRMPRHRRALTMEEV